MIDSKKFLQLVVIGVAVFTSQLSLSEPSAGDLAFPDQAQMQRDWYNSHGLKNFNPCTLMSPEERLMNAQACRIVDQGASLGPESDPCRKLSVEQKAENPRCDTMVSSLSAPVQKPGGVSGESVREVQNSNATFF